ncbi:MAG: hypothetical protein U9Q63_03790, partial [Patescibacteria group bacterium]|nr:hypothetical protein [Patescibacteria group bacterium]
KDKRLASYITHIFEKDFIQKEFDTGFAKLITDKPAGSVYDPFLQKRLGKMGYVEDVWRALQAYTKRAVRKEAMDPALKQLKESAVDLDKESLNYVMRLTHRINMRPTEVDNLIDNYIKSSPVGYKLGARPVSVISKSIRQAIYRGTLGLNIGSSMKNLSQGTNTYAKLGKKYTTAGYIDLIKKGNTGIEELKKVGVLEDSFIQDRSFNVVKQTMEKVDKGLFYFFETAEKINRGSAYFGAKKKALAEGKSEAKAIEYAKKMVRDTQFKFGAIDTPVILGSDTAKILLQFKSFTFKQAEFLGSMYKEKDWGGLMRWIASNVVVYSTIGRSFGWRIEDIIPDFKFQSPTGQLVKAGGKALSLDEDTRKEGRKELIKTVPGLIFPAGTQIKKTYEGAKLLTKGYSETPSGQARFLAPKGPIGKAQALAFGQWSTKQAKKYFKRGGHPTSAETMVKRKVVEALIKGDNEALNKLAPEAVKYSVDSKKAIKEAMALAIVENDDEAIKRIYPLIKKHGISNKVLKTAVRDLTYSTRDKNKMKVKMAKAILDDDDKKIKKLYSEFKKMGITDEALRKEIKKLK